MIQTVLCKTERRDNDGGVTLLTVRVRDKRKREVGTMATTHKEILCVETDQITDDKHAAT